MQGITAIGNNIAFALLGILTVIILLLLLLAWRNPVLFKLGLRNIPRRPAQSILIIVGLTLSTIIIVASFATGDTLNYSVQRQAVAAYGTIDEIIAPPLLSLFASMSSGPGGPGGETEAQAQAEEQFNNLFEGGLTSVLTVLQGGLPGIQTDRLDQLKAEAAQQPLIDGVAGSILFPTIIRNQTTGQGEPIGFIFAVDNDYDQTFGLTRTDGQKLEIESLQPGVGNIFVGAANLFGMVGSVGQSLGISLTVDNVATTVAAVGALVSGVQTGDASSLANLAVDLSTLERFGIDTAPLKAQGITQLRVADLLQAVPGLQDLLGSTAGITGTLGITDTATVQALQNLLGTLPLAAGAGITSTAGITAAGEITAAAAVTGASAAARPHANETPVPNVGVLASAQPLTATASVTASAAATGLLGGIVKRGADLLSSINLNTMGSELDRVLGQVGLQLKQGDVYLNRIGADRLGAQTGDVLEIFIGPIPVPFRVKAVVDEASPLGALLPVVVMRLDEAQKLLFMPNKVNNMLVSNQGDMLGGLPYTNEVSDQLRELAMEPDALARVTDILRTPAMRRAIEDAAAQGTQGAIGEDVPQWFLNIVGNFMPDFAALTAQMQALPAALDEPGVSPAVRTALANTNMRSRLLELDIPAASRQQLANEFGRLNIFDVIDPLSKQTVLSVSDVAGTIFSSLFSVFGFFSVLAGVILIFLIFVMLAAERRSEMGIARAVGVQRGHLVQMFVSEGMVYSLLAAVLGVLIGLVISFAMVNYLGAIVNSVAERATQSSAGVLDFAFRVSWRSLVISYSLGVLLTFLVVTISSWRVSRLNIVAAIRDLPDETNLRRQSVVGRVRRWLWPLLLIALGVLIGFYGYSWGLWSVVLAGVTVLLFGLMNIVGLLLAFTRLRPETIQRIIYTVIGLGLLALWITPWQRVLPTIGLSSFAGDPTQILAVFAIGGPMIITGAIMAIMFNATFFTWIIERLFGWIGSLTPVLKTAIAYPLSTRFRTGTAMVLFAMIMATVVIMALVIQATQSLITLSPAQSGGFEIQTSNTLLSFFDPLTDIDQALADAKARYPLLNQVAAVGSVAEQNVGVRLADSTGGNGRVDFGGLSSGFVRQAATIYHFAQRAEGYADDAAVWEALRTRDDVVVVRQDLVENGSTSGGPIAAVTVQDANGEDVQVSKSIGPTGVTVAVDERPNGAFDGRFRLPGVMLDAPFAPVSIDLLYNESSGFDSGDFGGGGSGTARVKRVQVIGVLEAGEMLASQSMQGNIAILDSLVGKPVQRGSNYLTVQPGSDVRAVAQEVERAFLPQGINATVMAEGFAQTQAFTRNILRLLQGFMALGLLVGIAGLGVITTRTVVERRQQVGMLRALGYQARMVGLSFILEASFIAITGILIGAATGIVLGMNIVNVAFNSVGVTYHLPWLSIIFVILLAYGFALLATIIPAWQASRIYPAEALRYE